MRVALCVISKFHHFELARQLMRHDALEKIYSGYPWWKLKNEGVPRSKVATWPWLHSSRMALARYKLLSRPVLQNLDDLTHRSFSAHVAKALPAGLDIFHGLGRYSLTAGIAAQKMGARFIVDVGSSHVQTHVDLVTSEAEALNCPVRKPHPNGIDRELKEYEVADLITVPSDFVLQSFLDRGVPREKIAKVPYGVDISRFSPRAVEDDGVFRVVFIGGLSLRKGIRYLIEGFNRAAIPNSELVLIGSMGAQTSHAVKGLNLDRVRMTGHLPQSELPTWLSRSKVFVLPSLEEGLAMVQLQALACGCPVIATTNTGGTEYIRHGENGFVVPIRDPDAIARHLIELADDPAKAKAMREAALKSAHQFGSATIYGDNMVRTYKALLADGPKAAAFTVTPSTGRER